MPYQTAEYAPPPMPEISSPIKSFEDVRSAVGKILEYLQRMQANNVLYFQHLIENLNQSSTTQGADIASASTITVTRFMHMVTGTATITTIQAPQHYAGQLMLVSENGFTLSTGGNISLPSSPESIPAGGHVLLTYLPSQKKWFAPY